MEMFKNFKKLLKIPGGRYIIVEHNEPQYVILNFKDYMKLAGEREYECEDEDYETDKDDEDEDGDDEDFVAEDWLSELNHDLEEVEDGAKKEEVKEAEPEVTVEPEKSAEKEAEKKEGKEKEEEELKVEDLPF